MGHSSLHHMIKSLFYRALIGLSGQLPLSALRRIGSAIGTVLWLTRSRMWLVTRENIERCYPALDDHRQFLLARESLRETGKTITETTFAWARPVETVLELIHEVHGQDAVDTAQKHHGIIFVIPHLGNWEIINHFLGKHYGLTHMYQPNRNRRLNEYIQARRSRTGTHFVPTSTTGIRAQRKVLADGGCIGVMPDQEPLIHTGRFAPFFDIEALTNELASRFAKTDASVFTAVCERTSNGFEISFTEVDVNATPGAELTILNSAIENAVRKRPAQYLWSYKRFRTRPEGKLDFYQFDRHPLRTLVESWLLWIFVQITRWLPRSSIGVLSSFISRIPLLLNRRRKIARINLSQCRLDKNLLQPSTAALVQSAIEAPQIWTKSKDGFSSVIESVEGSLDADRGSIVLTPPLASRETLMRYLGNHYVTTEYYHPNSITSLDNLIRKSREMNGIRLVEHDDAGRDYLKQQLNRKQVVTLCPDQQPRLRGGLFIPFFSIPALTTKTLPDLLKATQPELLLGIAWRHTNQFRISFEPLEYDQTQTDEDILLNVNRQLEAAVQRNPAQYRWSDKRFNIQPFGQPKIYR